MSTVARFQITDYDGSLHKFYCFSDGYPYDEMGVFAKFPRGDHDFCLETFVRRLELSKSGTEYWADIYYEMDLKTRMVNVSSGCYRNVDFKGSFEDAIRHFWDKDYSEKDALSQFPSPTDVISCSSVSAINWFWEIIRAVNYGIPEFEYDVLEQRIILIGDNPVFYTFNDFVTFPSCEMNNDYRAILDAKVNARRVGLMTYFKNKASNSCFTLYYMMKLRKDGYILPLTRTLIPYGHTISDDIKQEELEMIVELIKSNDLKTSKAYNIAYEHLPNSKLQEIRESLRKRKENSKTHK